MKTKNLIAITLCMILLFSFIPHFSSSADFVQPLDFYQKEEFN